MCLANLNGVDEDDGIPYMEYCQSVVPQDHRSAHAHSGSSLERTIDGNGTSGN